MNKIDLHMHSHISDDGQYTMQELLNIAKDANLKMIAIADHNSVKGHFETYDDYGIKVIKAIEMDCTFLGKDFHVLGYNVDIDNPIFDENEQFINKQEINATSYRIAYAKDKLGLILDENILALRNRDGKIVPEAICEAALAMEENKDNPFLKPYLPKGNRSDNPQVNFYWDYYSNGKEGYYPIQYLSMEEVIRIFRKQGADIVLAHPGNNVKEDLQLMDDIVALGIDGIEVYSSYHNEEQIEFYSKVCDKYNLLKTCGSDFHGRTKPSVKMGQCHMPTNMEENLTKYF